MRFASLLLPVLALSAQLANAQILDMATGTPGVEASGRPDRGATMAQVEARFGAPLAVRGPVGQPPIARWEYAGFVVFFEHDRVLHSVTVRPAP
ncbi:MAG: hypothetical protein IT483_15535 [Gammaproteobacteria bacterium]|nr:hypothetical protein [Gammaproteobacteria bacterium]